MEQTKYFLSEECRTQLRFLRQGVKMAAEDVSVALDHSKAWLGQIERGKLQSIKKKDLVRLLSIYTSTPEEEIESERTLENFLATGFAVPLLNDWYTKIDELDFTNALYRVIKDIDDEFEKEFLFDNIEAFRVCLEKFPGVMVPLLNHAESLFYILYKYSELSPNKFLRKTKTFSSKIAVLLDQEISQINHHLHDES